MLQRLEALVAAALSELGVTDLKGVKIDLSPRRELGDYATNAAIVSARKLSRQPLELAAELAARVRSDMFDRVEVAKPGFLNFFLNEKFIQQSVAGIIAQDKEWGRGTKDEGRILLEFVSANPTGPLHVGHGRWAVVGDAIARLLRTAGYAVETEFYVNNIGNQVDKLWASVQAARAGQPVPENGYGGAYIKEVKGNSKEECLASILSEQQATLKQLGVEFTRFFNESDLHAKGEVKEAISRLEKNGKTIVEEGAVWFKSEEMGDDKNRVLVRADGSPTYFAADLAYHLDKYARGFDRLIDIWGTDHHGYVKRVKAAVEAMGLPPEKLEIIIGQLVTLYRGNEPVRMSKRTGEMVTLQEVLDEIGPDATRFFFAASDVNSHLDFDLELAKKQSNDNPVFYVQYAHARICSILKKAGDEGRRTRDDLSSLNEPAERELMLKLLAWPDVVNGAARLRQPHKVTEYGKELATVFHHFYEKCRVIGNPARLLLVDASRITLRNVLELLGIKAPEAM
ncbi:MAG: arginine--tRNA ligase [Candidatus Margulisbacteria bacterium]|nr:arginine--tRNA ligase [Candidatus Margulisiibacteriota bacterium]